jgi:hypothetical protein
MIVNTATVQVTVTTNRREHRMAVKTKARATTKASTKKGGTKASAKASSNGGQKRADARKRDKELMAKVVKERKGGDSWGDIAKRHGITPGKAAFLVLISEVKGGRGNS